MKHNRKSTSFVIYKTYTLNKKSQLIQIRINYTLLYHFEHEQ